MSYYIGLETVLCVLAFPSPAACQQCATWFGGPCCFLFAQGQMTSLCEALSRRPCQASTHRKTEKSNGGDVCSITDLASCSLPALFLWPLPSDYTAWMLASDPDLPRLPMPTLATDSIRDCDGMGGWAEDDVWG